MAKRKQYWFCVLDHQLRAANTETAEQASDYCFGPGMRDRVYCMPIGGSSPAAMSGKRSAELTKKALNEYTQMVLERLRKEASTACQNRNHQMGDFETSVDGMSQVSSCQKCFRFVQVNAKPKPNEIDIGGSAVIVNCDPDVVQVATTKEEDYEEVLAMMDYDDVAVTEDGSFKMQRMGADSSIHIYRKKQPTIATIKPIRLGVVSEGGVDDEVLIVISKMFSNLGLQVSIPVMEDEEAWAILVSSETIPEMKDENTIDDWLNFKELKPQVGDITISYTDLNGKEMADEVIIRKDASPEHYKNMVERIQNEIK